MPTYLNHPIWIRSNHSVCAFYDGDVFGDDVSEAVRECEPLRKLDGGLDVREKMKNLIEHKVAIKLQKIYQRVPVKNSIYRSCSRVRW